MGVLQTIQTNLNNALRGASPAVLKAERAASDFHAAADKQLSEMQSAISQLHDIEVTGHQMGSAALRQIDRVKAGSGSLGQDKTDQAHKIKQQYQQMKQDDPSGFGDLVDEAEGVRQHYQNSPTNSRARDAKSQLREALLALTQGGGAATAATIEYHADAKQAELDDARDALISRFRLTTESLAKNNPQSMLLQEIQRLDKFITQMGERQNETISEPQFAGADKTLGRSITETMAL